MYWNVHLDGLERTHDIIVEREGVFKECVLAIRMAKLLGYQVATNTTIYKETDMKEIEQMFEFLCDLGVDGHTISPGYEYDAAKKDMVERLNLQPENFFLTREMTIEKFATSRSGGRATPSSARRSISNSWPANATDLLRLGHPDPQHPRLERPVLPEDRRRITSAATRSCSIKSEWDEYGVVNGVAKDPRCENCMVHCGYEPTASSA